MIKRKRILITGGAGFIGSQLADRLIELGHTITILDNLSTGLKSYINPKAKFVKGDTSSYAQVKKLFKNKFDVVCHIAGSASSIKSFTNSHQDVKANFLGTINIVNESVANKIPRFLYASSMTVYGNIEKLPIKESATLCRPISYYGISKYASERFVLATGERVDIQYPFNATSFRMFNVYGPRQSLTNPYQGVMAIFIGNVLRNEPVKIFGDGKQSRDFIYIDDVVDVWIKSIEDKKTFGNAYNLGFGIDISVNQLVATIIKTISNKKSYPILYKPPRPGDQRHMRSDITEIKRALSWKPKITLEKGLRRTIEWAIKESQK